MDFSPPASSVHGILQERILEWVAISFPRGSSQPRDGTRVSCISRWILDHWAAKEAHSKILPTNVFLWEHGLLWASDLSSSPTRRQSAYLRITSAGLSCSDYLVQRQSHHDVSREALGISSTLCPVGACQWAALTRAFPERPSASLALYARCVPASEQPWHVLSLDSSAPRKMGDTWKDLSHTSSWSEVQLTCSLMQNCSAKSSLDQPVHTLLQTHEQEINAPWCKPLSLGIVFFLSTICG